MGLVARAHQPNRIAIRVVNDGEARSPERVIRRLPSAMAMGDEIRKELIDLVSGLGRETEHRRAADRPFVAAVPDTREVGAVKLDAKSVRQLGDGVLGGRRVDRPPEPSIEGQCRRHIADDEVDLAEPGGRTSPVSQPGGQGESRGVPQADRRAVC